MSHPSPVRLLLGPQRPSRNLGEALAAAELPDGPLAVISAGWQEAEGDIDEIHELVQRPLVDLRLYHRAGELFRRDERLREAYRARQDRLQELQRLYRLRLRQLGAAARAVLGAEGDLGMLAPEQRHAIAQLRALDRHHLNRVTLIHRAFETEFNTGSYAPLADHGVDIERVLRQCAGVLITGGNVVVLLNRLRLFGVQRLLAGLPLVAWSAGAMLLAERIVLFHDRTPLGRRDAEIMSAGVGVVPGFVFLPDARHRLRENDPERLGLLSRRFSPDRCVTLDSGAVLRVRGTRLVAADSVRRVSRDGRMRVLRAA